MKKKIIEEREKLRDKTVVQVAEGIEAVHGLNVKVRRSLKGHNAKVLCLDWSIDKRHLVSSSQVRIIIFMKICGRVIDLRLKTKPRLAENQISFG